MKLIALPAFSDNYIWLLHDGHEALVVDPGEPGPVLEALRRDGLQLRQILVTHHHGDHTGGVAALREATGAEVHAPAGEAVPQPATGHRGGGQLLALGLDWQVLDVPGHTAGHIAFYTAELDGAPLLFSGDTLFSGGCGRLFEGTPAQMLASLDALAALPAATRVCCAHEYTLSNLRFAAAVEPANTELAAYRARCEALRETGAPTLPSTVGLERQVNPFLRSRVATVRDAVVAATPGLDGRDEVAVFAALREWKNGFR